MKNDPISNLAAVTLAMHDEMAQPYYEGKDAVLACCTAFLAVATRPARAKQEVLERRIKD